MRITKRQLRRIIKEEKAKLKEVEMDPGLMRALGAEIFDPGYLYDLLYDDIADMRDADGVVPAGAFAKLEAAFARAVRELKEDLS